MKKKECPMSGPDGLEFGVAGAKAKQCDERRGDAMISRLYSLSGTSEGQGEGGTGNPSFTGRDAEARGFIVSKSRLI
jgi:hypothetical protein